MVLPVRLVAIACLTAVACGGESGSIAADAAVAVADAAAADAASGDGSGAAPDAGVDARVDPGETSGTRLRLTWLSSNGHRVRHGVRDTGLDADCSFELTADGAWRCLPAYPRVSDYGDSFLDDQCSQPFVGNRDVCRRGPPARVLYHDAACGAHVRVVKPTGIYINHSYRRVDGQCERITYGAAQLVYEVGDAVPFSDFVDGERDLRGVGRVQAVFVRGSDGSRVRQGQHDTELGVDCAYDTSPAPDQCLPVGTVRATRAYSDESCTTAIDQVNAVALSCRSHHATVSGVCEPTELRPIGELEASVRRWSKAVYTDACQLDTYPPPPRVLALGAAVDPPAEVSIGTEGAGLVGRASYDPGDVLALGGLVDTARGIDCAPRVGRDGVLRCFATAGAAVYRYYTDASCTTEIMLANRLREPAASRCLPDPRYIVENLGLACERIQRQVKLGARRPASQVYTAFNGQNCHLADQTESYWEIEELEAVGQVPAVDIVVE